MNLFILLYFIVMIVSFITVVYHTVRIGLSVILWNSLKVSDKQSIRQVALASTVFWSLHCGGMHAFIRRPLSAVFLAIQLSLITSSGTETSNYKTAKRSSR